MFLQVSVAVERLEGRSFQQAINGVVELVNRFSERLLAFIESAFELFAGFVKLFANKFVQRAVRNAYCVSSMVELSE